jgi:hypothetical protein
LLPTIALISCQDAPVRAIERKALFQLDIGGSENEVDLFQIQGIPMAERTEIFMRDGLVYLSNGPANKIMEFTSYGDLISLVYNASQNPEPVLLRATGGENTITNRDANPYPFTRVGNIAVASDRMVLAEDRLPQERTIYDEELGVTLNRLVLRFDANGELLDYMGQEGIGGTPFPYIEEIHVTARDAVVVVSRTADAWLVFWFTKAGEPLYNVEISRARLPVPEDERVIPVLETVVPDRERPRLYLKINYYQESIDEQTGSAYGINMLGSRIYHLDLQSGSYTDFAEVPQNTQPAPAGSLFSEESITYHYQLIGTAPEEHLFLLSRESEERSQLMIMKADGRVLKRRYLSFTEDESVYRDIHVSPNGIVTALLGFRNRAEVSWWRTDALIGDIGP